MRPWICRRGLCRDYGLPQRALTAVSGRTGDVAELITTRLAALAHSGPHALDEPAVRAVVRQAVHDVRTAQLPAPAGPPAPADPPTDPALTALRAVVELGEVGDFVGMLHDHSSWLVPVQYISLYETLE
ncbi:hypothetical protein ACFWBI_21610 [Streptomyces sp. NPDC059982]|uniref:hypothetical protein n=1 Tax=unclassified Streptomyces TaxID=2593676 RepID=UPI0036AA7DEE